MQRTAEQIADDIADIIIAHIEALPLGQRDGAINALRELGEKAEMKGSHAEIRWS